MMLVKDCCDLCGGCRRLVEGVFVVTIYYTVLGSGLKIVMP